MPWQPSSGAPKIPKAPAVDKVSAAARRGLRLATALALLGATSSQALPVQIAWQVPLAKTETYLLEVAKDPGFSAVAHTAEVRGAATYVWDAPEEGVYHWRLARPGQTGHGGEVVTFVSGSFAAIDVDAARLRPARLTWAAEPGADRYKLYVIDSTGKARTMIATTPSFLVPQADRALMVEVVPYSGTQRVFSHYHYNPTLTLDSGMPPVPEESPPAPVAPPPAAEAPPPPPPPEPAAPATPVSRPRMHLVHLYLFGGPEELRLQKLEVDLRDRAVVRGAGAGVWTNATLGLIVGAAGEYHEHQADLTQGDVLPGATTPMHAARYAVDLTVGWDVLTSFASRWHRLVLAFVASGTQLPYLPLAYTTASGEAPRLEKKAVTMLGGSAAYGYFGEYVAGILEGGLTKDEADDATRAYQRLLVEIYLAERTALHVGAVNRLTTSARCHADREICLGEGASRTTAKETYGLLGLGVVFR